MPRATRFKSSSRAERAKRKELRRILDNEAQQSNEIAGLKAELAKAHKEITDLKANLAHGRLRVRIRMEMIDKLAPLPVLEDASLPDPIMKNDVDVTSAAGMPLSLVVNREVRDTVLGDLRSILKNYCTTRRQDMERKSIGRQSLQAPDDAEVHYYASDGLWMRGWLNHVAKAVHTSGVPEDFYAYSDGLSEVRRSMIRKCLRENAVQLFQFAVLRSEDPEEVLRHVILNMSDREFDLNAARWRRKAKGLPK